MEKEVDSNSLVCGDSAGGAGVGRRAGRVCRGGDKPTPAAGSTGVVGGRVDGVDAGGAGGADGVGRVPIISPTGTPVSQDPYDEKRDVRGTETGSSGVERGVVGTI